MYYYIWEMYLSMQEKIYVLMIKKFWSMVYNKWDKWFKSRKIFKAYYGFRVLYVFPFPSAGHWPMGFGSWQSWYQSNGFIAEF